MTGTVVEAATAFGRLFSKEDHLGQELDFRFASFGLNLTAVVDGDGLFNDMYFRSLYWKKTLSTELLFC
jgi:hypothetical protein